MEGAQSRVRLGALPKAELQEILRAAIGAAIFNLHFRFE
jgi:hypothetical protein